MIFIGLLATVITLIMVAWRYRDKWDEEKARRRLFKLMWHGAIRENRKLQDKLKELQRDAHEWVEVELDSNELYSE